MTVAASPLKLPTNVPAVIVPVEEILLAPIFNVLLKFIVPEAVSVLVNVVGRAILFDVILPLLAAPAV